MNIADDFLAELGYELPATRILLERVPDDKGPFKPHPKSSALGPPGAARREDAGDLDEDRQGHRPRSG